MGQTVIRHLGAGHVHRYRATEQRPVASMPTTCTKVSYEDFVPDAHTLRAQRTKAQRPYCVRL